MSASLDCLLMGRGQGGNDLLDRAPPGLTPFLQLPHQMRVIGHAPAKARRLLFRHLKVTADQIREIGVLRHAATMREESHISQGKLPTGHAAAVVGFSQGMLNTDRVKMRLQRALDETGWKPRPLSVKAGLGATWVRDVLAGRVRSPKVESLRQIGVVLGVPLGYFTAENNPPSLDASPESALRPEPTGQDIAIPELAVTPQAGGGADMPEMYGDGHHPVVGHWTMPADYLRSHVSHPNDVRVLRVAGDSMEPEYPAGERVMVDTSHRVPSPPGVYVLWDGFGLVLKRLELIIGTGHPRLRISSVNSAAYPPYERALDEVVINGRVIGKWQWR